MRRIRHNPYGGNGYGDYGAEDSMWEWTNPLTWWGEKTGLMSSKDAAQKEAERIAAEQAATPAYTVAFDPSTLVSGGAPGVYKGAGGYYYKLYPNNSLEYSRGGAWQSVRAGSKQDLAIRKEIATKKPMTQAQIQAAGIGRAAPPKAPGAPADPRDLLKKLGTDEPLPNWVIPTAVGVTALLVLFAFRPRPRASYGPRY